MDFFDEHPEFERYGESSVKIDGGILIKILYDPDPATPFEVCDLPDSFGIDLSNHRDWKGGEYGEACPVDVSEFLRWFEHVGDFYPSGEVENEVWGFMQFDKNYHWLPVYMYDHSGRTIRTTPYGDRWDSGCAGVVFIKKAVAVKERLNDIGRKWNADKNRELAGVYLNAWVQELDDYMTGNIFGFDVEKDDETIESCWNFIGDLGHEECCRQAFQIANNHKTSDSIRT